MSARRPSRRAPRTVRVLALKTGSTSATATLAELAPSGTVAFEQPKIAGNALRAGHGAATNAIGSVP